MTRNPRSRQRNDGGNARCEKHSNSQGEPIFIMIRSPEEPIEPDPDKLLYPDAPANPEEPDMPDGPNSATPIVPADPKNAEPRL